MEKSESTLSEITNEANFISGSSCLYKDKNLHNNITTLVDKKLSSLPNLKPQFKNLPNSHNLPKNSSKQNSRFEKIAHTIPMLSLENAHNFEDVIQFIERIKKRLLENSNEKISFQINNNNNELIINNEFQINNKHNNIQNIKKNKLNLEFVCEPKYDGISFAAIYKNGKLQHALTRGDGDFGENVTSNVRHVIDMIIDIKQDIDFEVRGEIYINKEDFLELNENQKIHNKPLFANPRNVAAGSLRTLKSNFIANRKLRYTLYGGFINQINQVNQIKTHAEMMNFFATLKFNVPDKNHTIVACSLYDMKQYYEKMKNIRKDLTFDIDGLVYKINDLELYKILGETNAFPRGAIAHKFSSSEAVTEIMNIVLQVSRHGALTPVAILKPINIGGVLITKANLHNENEIKRKDIRIGDVVTVKRSGDVIPKIIKVNIDKRLPNLTEYQFPLYCPTCGSEIKNFDNEIVKRCTGGKNCKSQLIETIYHLASKFAFNIRDLGIQQIQQLCEYNILNDIIDIFHLSQINSNILEEKRLENKYGWGLKSVQNLFQSIENSRIINLNNFIYALGIRCVGEHTSILLSSQYYSLDNFLKLSENNTEVNILNELSNIKGIGFKIANEIAKFMMNSINIKLINDLKKEVTVLDYNNNKIQNDFSKDIKEQSIFFDKNIVFTGSLINCTRIKAKKIAALMGAKIQSYITSKTDYIIVGNNAGSKLDEAIKLNISLIYEEEWNENIMKYKVEKE